MCTRWYLIFIASVACIAQCPSRVFYNSVICFSLFQNGDKSLDAARLSHQRLVIGIIVGQMLQIGGSVGGDRDISIVKQFNDGIERQIFEFFDSLCAAQCC